MLWGVGIYFRGLFLRGNWISKSRLFHLPGFSMGSEGFWEYGIFLVVRIKMGCLQKLIYSLFSKGLWWRVVRDHFNLSSVCGMVLSLFYSSLLKTFNSFVLISFNSPVRWTTRVGWWDSCFIFCKAGQAGYFFLGVASFCKIFIELNITFFAGLDDPIAVSVKDLPQASSAPIGRNR